MTLEDLTQSHFFVPRLVDKQQNPIVKNLNAVSQIEHLPHELGCSAQNTSHIPSDPKTRDDVWFDSVKRASASRCQIMSWDALRFCRGIDAPSHFLSEQDNVVFAAAQYSTQPRLQDPTISMIHVKLSDLFESLRMTILGSSSVLHTWNKSSETFVQSGARDGTRTVILINGMDEIISASFIRRFLTIGTLLRRMEAFVLALRNRSAREGPTIHAFIHSLSTILVFLRNSLARSPLYDSCPGESKTIATIWIHYAEFEAILLALSVFCNREEEKPPSAYAMLDSSPAQLLSRVYDHLRVHFARHSSRDITAAFAYILTNASQHYFRVICQSVGFGANPLNGISHNFQMIHHDIQLLGLQDDNTEDREDDVVEEEFPMFFPPDLSHALPTAKRSLKLLQAAQPDHPLLTGGRFEREITWMWSEEEITAAWNNRPVVLNPASPTIPDITAPSMNYKPDLADFCIFDLEPGSHLADTTLAGKSPITSTFRTFITTFPDKFPSITPSLEQVTWLVFIPLLEHSASLSSALLSLFLSPSHLNFRAHLTLLRSYLLLTSDSFKSRLATALFSDSEQGISDGQNAKLPFRPLLPPSEAVDTGESARSWVIGLAPALMQRETWPPGGADLSFLLRTVIVDSLELGHGKAQSVGGHPMENHSGRKRVFEEAEFRLGFAIRDLPVGTGRKRWLNPLSIEALDFLYLDYKPPHPLEVLISPEILSKYQRIFAFILRIMRVKNAACALFRMTRKQSKPLFATLASSNKLLLHFRFIAHSFVDSLSAYVFDTAIGGHFGPFLACLSPAATSKGTPKFADVFSLAKYHSAVLDDILNACLLRTGQRAVGDLLRHALEVVLDFTILASDLRMGCLAEYQAAPMMEDLFQVFREKMTTLTMVLKSLAEKGPTESRISFEGPTNRRPDRTENLYNLLIRLDLGDWWSKVTK